MAANEIASDQKSEIKNHHSSIKQEANKDTHHSRMKEANKDTHKQTRTPIIRAYASTHTT